MMFTLKTHSNLFISRLTTPGKFISSGENLRRYLMPILCTILDSEYLMTKMAFNSANFTKLLFNATNLT